MSYISLAIRISELSRIAFPYSIVSTKENKFRNKGSLIFLLTKWNSVKGIEFKGFKFKKCLKPFNQQNLNKNLESILFEKIID